LSNKNHTSLKISFIFLLASTLILCQETVHLLSNAVVGGVTHNSARIRVEVSGESEITIMYSTSETFTDPLYSDSYNAEPGEDYSAIFELSSLQPLTLYYYRVMINGTASDSLNRSFKTFPVPGALTSFSFAFGSCQQSVASSRGRVFSEIVEHNPSFFIQTGDWTYPDTTENLPLNRDFFPLDYRRVVQTYRAKFRSDYGMDTLIRSVPVSYVYDDHDYINNNASAVSASYSIPFKSSLWGNDFIIQEIEVPEAARLNSIRGFTANMPDYPVENESRGIYRKFTYGNSEIYMLDLRSQRSPNLNSLSKNTETGKWEFIRPEEHTILGNNTSPGNGEDQFTWLKRSLKESSAKWKFLISSVPLNKGQMKGMQLGIEMQDSLLQVPGSPLLVYGIIVPMELTDKWVGFADDMDSLLSFINGNNISNVFVLSGDSHTAAMDDGTSSGLPEIMAGNLDIPNSGTAALFISLGINIWNKGGQGISVDKMNNAFGNAEVHGNDSVVFKLIDEEGSLISSLTMYDQSVLNPLLSLLSAERKTGRVELDWSVSGISSIKDFEVQKSDDRVIFKTVGNVLKDGYEYTFSDIYEEKFIYYRLRINANNGSYKFTEQVMIGDETIPSFYLLQNYPNPFNTSTRIRFSIPGDSRVAITLYNILGESAGTVLNEFRPMGVHEVEINASRLSSGIYFYRITSGNYSAVKKMVLLK
jgi:phosphodiesterase/alkaline phosphatase D-like protein